MSKFKLCDRSRNTNAYARNISRTFLYNTFKTIQLSVLHHISTIIFDDIKFIVNDEN